MDEFVEKTLIKEDTQRQKRAREETPERRESSRVVDASSPNNPNISVPANTGGASSSGLTQAERKRQHEEVEAGDTVDAARRRVDEKKGEKRELEMDVGDPVAEPRECKARVNGLEVHQEIEEECEYFKDG